MSRVFFMLWLIASPCWAGEGRVLRVHPLGYADASVVLEQVRTVIGPDGKVALDAPRQRLLVTATEEQHRQIAEIIRALSVPPKNIQIQVRITDLTGGGARGIGVTDVRGGIIIGGGTQIRGGATGVLGDTGLQSSQESLQTITVTSGGRGYITVAEEVPYVDWFLDYAVLWGYLRPGTVWRQVGSRLLVEPRVVGDGNLIHIKLTPEFSYFLDNQRCQTAIINAATELTVANGQEFVVGGTAQNKEFMSRFLVGYDRNRQQRVVNIVLKATVLP
ncbi:MAG: hypothetical protein N3B01_00820 [Verrucomicrobiae bacterium]|nr:hypothetical protein [Verrucomicrobiae bacterium]